MDMDVFEELERRGFIYQCTDSDGLRSILAQKKVTFYVGFDPTASSLHVGSLIPIMAMVWLQKSGHRPIALLGGGTAMIGDPSGKKEMRKIISREEIVKNAQGIEKQLRKFLNLDGTAGLLLDNSKWLLNLGYIPFLRDIGRFMSVNRMLARESARLRYESPEGLSFLEFNYACLQAYDFYVLYRDYDCILQMGGQDQWGNICEGIDLIGRPEILGKKAYGLTFPLLLSSTGEKFGKSVGGNVWLDSSLTSPYDYYQFWRNTDDRDVMRYLMMFTQLPYEEAKRLGSLEPPMINRAKEILAFECTMALHGFETASKVYAGAVSIFGCCDDAERIPTTSRIIEAQRMVTMEKEIPAIELEREEVEAGIEIVDLLARSGLCSSKSQARRCIQQGGVYLDGERVKDLNMKIGFSFLEKGSLSLRVGKKLIRKIFLKK